MIEFIEEMIKASEAAKLPLNMNDWYCGTSCCLMGDLATYRLRKNKNNFCDLIDYVESLSIEFNEVSIRKTGSNSVALSVYASATSCRGMYAIDSGFFTKEELNHPHLTTDHNDRVIAIDYMRLVISKLRAMEVNEKSN